MFKSKIQKITKEPIVRFSGNAVILPADLQEESDACWQVLLDSGRKYFNGEVFTVHKIIKDNANNVAEIIVNKTNYAHFIYDRRTEKDLGLYKVKTVFSSGVVLSSDNKIIFGRMGKHTSWAGRWQFAGGGLEDEDRQGNIFNMKHSVIKELKEELGIDAGDVQRVKKNEIVYCDIGINDNIAIIYQVRLNETSDSFMKKYQVFTQSLKREGKTPEFDKVTLLNRDKSDIEKFLKNNSNNLCLQ